MVYQGKLRLFEPVTKYLALPHEQQRPVKTVIAGHQVIDEDMAIALINAGTRRRMPSEMIAFCASLAAADAGGAVYKGILVHLYITAVEDMYSKFTVDKYIAGTYGAFGYLKKETTLTGPCLQIGDFPVYIFYTFHPVVNENTIHIAHIIPDAV
jgi:hypothetical protein